MRKLATVMVLTILCAGFSQAQETNNNVPITNIRSSDASIFDDSGDKLVLPPEKAPVVWDLSKDKTMPGRKVALTEFDKDFPTDWTPYNYLVLEMNSSSAQRVYLGVNTNDGYNELRFIFYAPKGWIRTAIPLTYFRDLPAGAHDLAATYNHKRPLSYINIDHGKRSALVGVDSIGVRMHMPVKDEQVQIAKAYLTVEDPGDEYLGVIPVTDEFGQWNLGEFEGKVHSEAELKAAWAAEEADLKSFVDTKHSKYGGDLSRKTKGTGYFRVMQKKGKWWFVDPDGYYFLSIGSNGMSPGGAGSVVNPLKGLYTDKAPEGYTEPEMPARPGMPQAPQMQQPRKVLNITGWNNFRRYGTGDVRGKSNQLLVDRMTRWGVNTIGNWSGRDAMALGQKPFVTSLSGLRISNGILGMPDVYEEGFAEAIDEGVRLSVEPYVTNPMLVGYFVGNEPTWCNKELRLCDLIMEQPDGRPIKEALKQYLAANGDTPAARRAFVYQSYEKFLVAVCTALRKYDPNHLNLGYRFGSGVPEPEVLALSKKYFDVYSFNQYSLKPNLKDFDEIYKATGLPMLIGEFHFGTTDRGLGESLVRVTSQEERGVAYRYYIETAFSHPALIGAHWFTWYDQPLFGRGDGENYNIGFIDATDRPYEHMVKAVQDVSNDCYDVHAGKKDAYDREPVRAGGRFLDKWE